MEYVELNQLCKHVKISGVVFQVFEKPGDIKWNFVPVKLKLKYLSCCHWNDNSLAADSLAADSYSILLFYDYDSSISLTNDDAQLVPDIHVPYSE